jgi:hypothetical protein
MGTVDEIIPGNNIEEKEKYLLDNFPILKLEGLDSVNEDLDKFIYNFLYTYNQKRHTITVLDNAHHTHYGRHRSLIDIYLICRYYYPEVSLKEVKISLMENVLVGQTCGFIKRRVYELKKLKLDWKFYSNEQLDEFGYKLNQVNTDEYIEYSDKQKEELKEFPVEV